LNLTLYITLALLFGFFIESIFGFAGTVISLAILGFFIDIKLLVSLILFVATIASICVLITDRKSFSKPQYLQMIKRAIPGAILGSFLFTYLSSEILLKILSILLLGLAIQSFYEPKFKQSLTNLMLFISGIIHGIFGLGGVTAIGIMKNKFQNKSQVRATFAAFFISLNLIRFIQYSLQNTIQIKDIISFWWIPAPLLITIWFGHKVHLKISETFFKKGISVLLLITGIFFLLK